MFDANMRFILYEHLEMHWAAMVPPGVGIVPLMVRTTAFEFISAQSPHFMKGLIVGLFFAIVGVFELFGAVALIPFSLKEVWDTDSMRENPPITNCGFGYILLTFAVSLVGRIVFMIVVKKYTYRVRDEEPYNQSQVEEIVSCTLSDSYIAINSYSLVIAIFLFVVNVSFSDFLCTYMKV